MRYARILLALTIVGCGREHTGRLPVDPIGQSPVEPTGQPAGPAWLWGMAVRASGVCIEGAIARLVSGPRAGETVPQKTPCDAWAYDGGFIFTNLTVGAEVTVQVSAPGYAVEEKKIIPSSGPQMAILFQPQPVH